MAANRLIHEDGQFALLAACAAGGHVSRHLIFLVVLSCFGRIIAEIPPPHSTFYVVNR